MYVRYTGGSKWHLHALLANAFEYRRWVGSCRISPRICGGIPFPQKCKKALQKLKLKYKHKNTQQMKKL
jgi:hypothetical protein